MTSNSIYDCITDNVVAKFKSTRLYIKRHSVTGLLYFGRSTKVGKAFDNYLGSGKLWVRHCKKYGKDHVETIWVSEFYTKDRIQDLVCDALGYSADYDVVDSDIWANMVPENGLDGYPAGAKRGPQNAERRAASSVARIDKKLSSAHCAAISAGMADITRTSEHNAKIAVGLTGKKHTPEHVENNRAAQLAAAARRRDTGIPHGNTGNTGKKRGPGKKRLKIS